MTEGNALIGTLILRLNQSVVGKKLQMVFLNRFNSTWHTIGMIELTNTKQRKGGQLFINISRALSIDCKDQLVKVSAIQICIQCMNWGLQYILRGVRPWNFEGLATLAHDMELSIASHSGKSFGNWPTKRQRRRTKNYKKTKSSIKETTAVVATPVKVIEKDRKKEPV